MVYHIIVDYEPVQRREDPRVPVAGVRPAPLQADAPLLHGRDRCGPGLQECLHHRELHQGAHQERPVHRHLPAE